MADGSFQGTAEEYRNEVVPEMLHDLRSRIGALPDPAQRAAAADAADKVVVGFMLPPRCSARQQRRRSRQK